MLLKYSLTFFANEETQATFAGNAPWLRQDRLTLHVAEDGNLVTGQQNHFSGAAASRIVQLLESSR